MKTYNEFLLEIDEVLSFSARRAVGRRMKMMSKKKKLFEFIDNFVVVTSPPDIHFDEVQECFDEILEEVNDNENS